MEAIGLPTPAPPLYSTNFFPEMSDSDGLQSSAADWILVAVTLRFAKKQKAEIAKADCLLSSRRHLTLRVSHSLRAD
jgi:hypothetical protein